MRHTRSWLFIFLPFLYVGIVFGLIAIQFSKKSDTFSQSSGELSITGKASNGSQPAELTLRGRGLEFSFDATRVLQVEAADGTVSRVRPLAWSWKDGNVAVNFQQGLQLTFEKADGGRSLLIRPSGTEALKRFAVLRIPFGPENGTRLSVSPRGTLMEVTRDKLRLLASVDGERDRIDLDRTFVLTSGEKGFRPARIDLLPPGLTPDLAWLTLDNVADPASAEEALNKYWDKAYAGWASSATFSTALVDAWGREALRRGDYPAAFSRIQSLLTQSGASWGFQAESYLGNVVELTAQHRRTLEAASSRSQPNWEGQGRLWLQAGYYGPDGSADRVKGLLLSSPLPDDVASLTAVLQNLLTLQVRQPSEAVTARLQDVLKALQVRVIRREGDLFVQNQSGLLDLKSGLILGRVWLDYSKTLANEAYGSAGAQLILSAFSRIDAAGRLPEFLVTQEGRVVRQEGRILPEELYETVYPAAPAETPVAEWGNGAFVRASSALVAQEVTAAQARFTFRFPAGSAQHILIVGVPEFNHIKLHGIRWRTDPQFQSYTDGWSYSAATKTLYAKIKHREDLEDIVIHFQPED